MPGVTAWRAALAPVMVASVAVGAGVVTFVAVGGAWWLAADDEDGWAELAAAVAGLAAGLLVAVTCYVVGLVVAVWRVCPRGGRRVPLAVGVLGPTAWCAVAFVVASSVPPLPGPALLATASTVLLAVVVVGGVMLAFAWCRLAAPGRGVVLRVGAVVVAAAVASEAFALAWGEVAERRAVAALPLVLFDGDDEAPFAGWRRDVLSGTSVQEARDVGGPGHQAWLKYFTPDGVTFVTMYSALRPCETRGGWACRRLGATPEGELRRYQAPSGDVHTAVAHDDGTGVAVRSTASTASVDAVAVLEALQRVDRRTFERQAGPLRLG